MVQEIFVVNEDSTIEETAWRDVQEETGIDILGIVSDLQSGRTSPSDTMDLISEHCKAFHNAMDKLAITDDMPEEVQ